MRTVPQCLVANLVAIVIVEDVVVVIAMVMEMEAETRRNDASDK